MVGRAVTHSAERRSESGRSLPIFERIAPAAAIADLAAEIEVWTKPGEAVLDLNGRGGWVARAAIAGQRRAADIESFSLTRLLAEVVLRPPDVRHLDAAALAIAGRAFAGTTVRKSIDGLFAGTCPTCGRAIVVESIVWEPGDGRSGAAPTTGATAGTRTGAKGGATAAAASRARSAVPGKAAARSAAAPTATARAAAPAQRAVRREYRCVPCHQQSGGPELLHTDPTQEDLTAAAFSAVPEALRNRLRDRFPVPRPDHRLVEQLLDLHSPRQLFGLGAILEGIESDARSAPLTAALRLAFIGAVDSAGRLNAYRGRPATLRIANGAVRMPAAHAWRERNPWSAFEESLKTVRAFVARLEADEKRSVAARFAADLIELQQGTANVTIAESTPGTLRRLGLAGERIAHSGTPSRVKLVLGQAPLRMTRERLGEAYHATAWALGAGAASLLPYDELFRPSPSVVPVNAAEDLARSIARSLAISTPALAQQGRAVVLLDDAEPRSLVAAGIGGAAAGCRLIGARLHRGGDASPGMAVFVPPTGVLTPGPRTRANRPLAPVEGGAGDPGTISVRGVFTAPEKLGEGPFRPVAAAQTVNDTAIELLKARGEPARFEHLIGDLLVGLDRSGQLARFARSFRVARADQGWEAWIDEPGAQRAAPGSVSPETDASEPQATAAQPAARRADPAAATNAGADGTDDAETAEPSGPVDELLALIRAELDRTTNRRVRQLEPGLYWLGQEEDRAAAAQPLADRTEWAIFGLLSATRQMSAAAVYDRARSMFQERDVPDGELLQACLRSYAAPGSTSEAVVTMDQLERRSAEHDAMIATIADLGHRLGTRVWIGRRQQQRRAGGAFLAESLDAEEREAQMSTIAWGPEAELEKVDAVWYVRHKATFFFEVEWTAMLADAVLLRHGRFPSDDKAVRFLVVPPERAALVAYKLERSPLLRNAFAERNWHVLKWDQLAAFAARDEVSLADMEPYLGIDANATAGEQLPLFEA
jgi:hypothetical protein